MFDKIVAIFDFIWGIPLTIFIVLAGIYFSFCTGFLQLTGIKKVFKNTIGKIKEKDSYKTIMSVLGGTVGSGNIAGIATAIAVGGPGAIFWMWVVAFFSMATKMVEVTLAVKHQKKDKDGNNVGGPMYYIKSIKSKIAKPLAFIYSIALMIYVLCDAGFVQINTVSTSLMDTFSIKPILVGAILLILSIFIINGGLKRISKILEKAVPSMCIFYLVAAMIVIVVNIGNLPLALKQIVKYAFKPAPIIGGFAGATVVQAIAKGAARGIFANEAGTGTSTTVHATTNNPPVRQGMWGMLEVAIVSFVVCTITALLVMTTKTWSLGLDGAPMVLKAFESLYGTFGKYVLCVVIVSFAYSTYIGFFYEFTTCMRYLFSEKNLKILKWIYIIPVIFAVFLPIDVIWTFADMSVGFIMIPNLIALLLLSKEFKKIYRAELNEKIQN